MFYKTLGFLIAVSVLLITPSTISAQDVRHLLQQEEGWHSGGRPDHTRRTVVRRPATLPNCQQGPMIIPPCPANTTLVIWDSPVYDENGIFVVCTEKVPFCVPEGLEPEG